MISLPVARRQNWPARSPCSPYDVMVWTRRSFCDILVIPQAMNIHVEMKPGEGPWLPSPIRTQQDLDRVIVPDIHDTLGYVMEAIKMTKEKLNDEIPLIGFAGSPWTILCYCVQGQGSKNFDKAKQFCFTKPEVAHQLLQKITDTTIAYLREKLEPA